MHKKTALGASIVSIVAFIASGVLASKIPGGAVGLYAVAVIAAVVSWVAGLIKTAQLGRWGWFVEVLLLGFLGALIYGIAGPEEKKA